MTNIFDNLKELQKISVEFTDTTSENAYIAKSYIKRLDDDAILIDPPSVNNIVSIFEINQPIDLIISTQEGIYTGSCIVIGKELSRTSGLLVSYPTNVKFSQRREYIRIKLNTTISLHIKENNYSPDENIVQIVTHDISATGFAYISDKPLNNYYSILAKIQLPYDQNIIETSCDHIYSRKFISHNGSIKYRNAFMFTNISKLDNEKLIKVIFKFQLEQRRREKDL